jgi:transketolase
VSPASPAEKINLPDLREYARQLRVCSLKMIHAAGSGHPGGALSAADLVAALYFRVLRIDPTYPDWEDRDRFIMSKGHACPVWYSALALRGYFDSSELMRLRQLNSILQGHPDMLKTPGVDYTTGSLGQGLSIGVGMALAARVLQKSFRVFVMIGDGDLNEGATWEAVMCAAKYRLSSLKVIVDYNHLQLDGTEAEIMPTQPLADKWRAFRWSVIEIDGHDMPSIVAALGHPVNGPTAIVAETIKGKGVSFMENVCEWHGKAPTDEELAQALTELGEPR